MVYNRIRYISKPCSVFLQGFVVVSHGDFRTPKTSDNLGKKGFNTMLISWNSTQACNLKCKHCYRDAGDKATKELSTAEAKTLIDQIVKTGFRIMIFSGGEPLMRPDMIELVGYASSKGLRPVLGTNGTLLTPETVKALKEVGALRVGISLDSLDEARHNEFRGHPDAFAMTMAGIENCRAGGLDFQIHTTVTQMNKNEVLNMTDWCEANGAKGHHVFFLVPTGRGKEIEETTLHTDEYEGLLTALMEKQKHTSVEIKPTCAPQFMRIAQDQGLHLRYSRGCLAGISYCIISPIGDVQACPYLPVVSGNVRETPFDELWRNDEIFRQFRKEKPKGSCGVCKHYDICGGCRARAYYYTGGDYLAEEPWCKYSTHNIK